MSLETIEGVAAMEVGSAEIGKTCKAERDTEPESFMDAVGPRESVLLALTRRLCLRIKSRRHEYKC